MTTSDTMVNMTSHIYHLSDDVIHYINTAVIPAIGVFGVLGNTLNLAVLSWRCGKKDIDKLERRALIGLISLAISDLCLCLVMIPSAVFSESKTFFSDHSLEMYYRLYGNYFHNVFIKISTWLTVIIAGARYVGICHPLKARIMLGSMATKLAIALTFLLWIGLLSPLLASYDVQEMSDNNVTIGYVADLGVFNTNVKLKLIMTYLWAILGFFLPIFLLSIFNICLIRALRASHRLHQSMVRNRAGSRDNSTRITVTLVALVIMFMITVSPSEILHFYSEVVPESVFTMELFLTLGNLLQAVNFAFHFVLYCAVNVTFRSTVNNMACFVVNKLGCCRTETYPTNRQRSNSPPTQTISLSRQFLNKVNETQV